MSIQSVIYAKRSSLTPAAARVADVILADPSVVLSHTVTELAQMCSTSDPTVVRFCRAVGLAGYAQLRLEMAAELGRESAAAAEVRDPAFGDDISPGTSLADMVERIRFSEVMGLEETTRNLDLAALERAVKLVAAAGRINVYGVGAGAVVAEDLRYKLFRIGLNVSAFGNADNALMGASLMTAGDVAVAFSHGGKTASVVEFLRLARASGAPALLVTNAPASPAGAEASVCLATMVRETAFRSGAMASRMSQLAVVDCLFVAVAQRRYDRSVAALAATHQAVVGTDTGGSRA
ncbi:MULTISPECIES: MurR/RpiR family transcriptional regulator [unclassified Arthrobacter]|uniref:MurR/RpiR family transcriptional regulator n=1 Tax=unclassified Arthrobacter TaxID=235627 RepID=UPI00159DDBDA|nr:MULTISPECIES: MurR/RpiR family transcriptional regulator [unclassified Arthrobacter]MCQ9164877.1 MurR/RpiR family transcriptional regulator [Arthrobacter sp. STN4]NVM98173.1 MurR/RpiR family transcriptional regulator [Arthrobacter sp. SDTb3-6]